MTVVCGDIATPDGRPWRAVPGEAISVVQAQYQVSGSHHRIDAELQELCVCRPLQFDRHCPVNNSPAIPAGRLVSGRATHIRRAQSAPDPVSPGTGAQTAPLGKHAGAIGRQSSSDDGRDWTRSANVRLPLSKRNKNGYKRSNSSARADNTALPDSTPERAGSSSRHSSRKGNNTRYSRGSRAPSRARRLRARSRHRQAGLSACAGRAAAVNPIAASIAAATATPRPVFPNNLPTIIYTSVAWRSHKGRLRKSAI
jgi:hypothetical protein